MAHARGFGDVLHAIKGCTRWIDIGSGGGLPGLVVALDLPECTAMLLDGNERRTVFLRWAVEQLGVGDRVTVVRERAEEFARSPVADGIFDVVVARSFGSPGVTAECAARFLRVGGSLVVSEPPSADGERWFGLASTGIGLRLVRIETASLGSFAVLEKFSETPPTLPRRGSALKRPLF